MTETRETRVRRHVRRNRSYKQRRPAGKTDSYDKATAPAEKAFDKPHVRGYVKTVRYTPSSRRGWELGYWGRQMDMQMLAKELQQDYPDCEVLIEERWSAYRPEPIYYLYQRCR